MIAKQIEAFFKPGRDSDYTHWPHSDNVYVRRLADAQRCLREICLADAAIENERLELIAKIQSIRKKLADTQVSMVVAGSWNSGKSTLINAFLCERWMPTNVKRETVTVNCIRDGEHQHLKVIFHDGRVVHENYQKADDVHQKIQDFGLRQRENIQRIDVCYPGHPFLKWCAIIDTPGLDFSKEDSIVSQPLIDEADVLLWVMHVEGPRSQDHQALKTFRRRNSDSRILAVINYADTVDDSEYEEALQDKRERLSEVADAIFLVSAKNDLEKKGNDRGFKELRDYLNEQILPAYGMLNQRRPTRFALDLLGYISIFSQRLDDYFNRDAERLYQFNGYAIQWLKSNS
ncbi:MAG: dynamin family protein, partial [Lamprobacter sp.]|uniref:dynamin family protein n=1 Tax=Lamprobacter sp. TaxID=3100796 RepID=UPI002B25D903